MNSFSHGIRVLAKRPGFTAAAVLVLALGIGANAAIFSLVNAFLLKPLAIHNPEELVGLYSRDTRKPDKYRATLLPEFRRSARPERRFHQPCGPQPGDGGADRRRHDAPAVRRPGFVELLRHDGRPLFRGRVFTAEEERPGQRYAGGDRQLFLLEASRQPTRDARPDTAPQWAIVHGGRHHPEGFTGTTALISAELYVPLGVYTTMVNDFENHGRARWRLARQPCPDRHRASASRRDAWPRPTRNSPGLPRRCKRPGRWRTRIRRYWCARFRGWTCPPAPLRTTDWPCPRFCCLCMAAVVLLIASLNVANMMLARGAARRKEIAIRLALGGGRRDIVQQLLAESLMLALMGGAAGSVHRLVEHRSAGEFHVAAGSDRPGLQRDARPASARRHVRLLSVQHVAFWLHAGLESLAAGPGDGPQRGRMQGKQRQTRLFSRGNVLVMGQICLSLTLLTAAGLFLRSALRAARCAPGFRIANSDCGGTRPQPGRLQSDSAGREIYRGLLARLRALPGVESASIAATVPFGMTSNGSSIRREGSDPADTASLVSCQSNIVERELLSDHGDSAAARPNFPGGGRRRAQRQWCWTAWRPTASGRKGMPSASTSS